jgi:hypothetical protein
MAVFAPCTASGQCAIFPLGATLAEGAGGALADGAAEATLGVGAGELDPQLSHPASETTTTGTESSMTSRKRTSWWQRW